MLHLTNGSIVESLGDSAGSLGAQQSPNQLRASLQQSAYQNLQGGSLSGYTTGNCNHYPYQTQWYSYPVYVCSDKTAKSIEILKKLQAEKVIDVKSVPRFIELVEQISAIL